MRTDLFKVFSTVLTILFELIEVKIASDLERMTDSHFTSLPS